MNYRKFRKSKKGLSPVIASIILIAVTVAVSVVVAAWMGGMTIGLMGSAEKVAITNLAFDDVSHTINATMQNTGTVKVMLSSVYVTGGTVTAATIPADTTINVVTGAQTVVITVTGNLDPGTEYTVKFTTSKANTLTYSQVMP